MDKVDLSSASILNPSLLAGLKQNNQKAQGKKGIGANKDSIFSDLVEKSMDKYSQELGPLRSYAPSEEILTELMDAVHSAGSDLLDRPFHEEIIQYKKAVRDFIHYVVENCYGVEKSQTRLREMRNLKPHVQVQIIDNKLEELAAAILSGQKDKLQIVSQVNEIKGLLVDLTISGMIKERDD